MNCEIARSGGCLVDMDKVCVSLQTFTDPRFKWCVCLFVCLC